MRESHSLGHIKHIGVVGACGGAGASSVAAAIARARALSQSSVLVDLADCAGGLDVLLGVEETPGVRWADLGAVRGEVSGAELAELLPRWGEVAVLSADRTRPETVAQRCQDLVLSALAQVGDLVVDFGSTHLAAAAQLCDLVVIVVPRHVRAVAGGQATIARLTDAGLAPSQMALVVRGPAPGGLDPLHIEQVLNLPLAAHMASDRGLAAAIERGVGPQGRKLDRAAHRVLRYAARALPAVPRAPARFERPTFGRAA